VGCLLHVVGGLPAFALQQLRHVGPGIEGLDVAADDAARAGPADILHGLREPQLQALRFDGLEIADHVAPSSRGVAGDELRTDVWQRAKRGTENNEIEVSATS